MVNPRSLANLKRGGAPNKGKRNKRPNKVARSKTWAALIVEYGETVSDIDPTKTWKQVVVSAAYRQAALGNAPILRELMQRSEPQEQAMRVIGALPVQVVDYAGAMRPMKPDETNE